MKAYESEHHCIDIADISPIDMLKYLMEEQGMNASDLGRLLGNRTLGSSLLRGERSLSKSHIKVLSEYFGLSTDVFM